ncbi:MAG: quinoprotein dehydrogenase-associated putative ABC transporter substrate-binding protein [Proteobacteria bacterium]|nr:quinoprotein dehydrogenase-associated putative ABC transporter substrate-binding protein [Pseudomonadota bacterium]
MGTVDSNTRRRSRFWLAATLAVCADPNSLPLSNQKLQGFENVIAALIATDLHRTVRYTWYPMRRGFLRKTLNARLCDVVMGLPADLEGVATTRPYYSSTYVFVSSRQGSWQPAGLDDPALSHKKIGLPIIGAEGSNAPPAMALAARGLGANVVGYPVWASDSESTPQGRLVDAVTTGRIDTAIVWGPVGGYFAQHRRNPLLVSPIARDPRLPELTFQFPIAIGVRRGEEALRDEIQEVIDRRQSDINAVLKRYGVPLTHDRS